MSAAPALLLHGGAGPDSAATVPRGAHQDVVDVLDDQLDGN